MQPRVWRPILSSLVFGIRFEVIEMSNSPEHSIVKMLYRKNGYLLVGT